MLKIANLIIDEKFIDDVISFHDIINYNCIHDYIIVSKYPIKHFKYIKNAQRVIVVKPNQFLLFLEKNSYNIIFLHSLNVLSYKNIANISAKIKVCWFAWGYDIYYNSLGAPIIPLMLLHTETRKILDQNHTKDFSFFRKTICSFIKNNIRKIIDKQALPTYSDWVKAVGRVDFFSGVLPVEFELANRNNFFHAKQIRYVYTDCCMAEKISDVNCFSNNIIIGNSGDPGNNHLDIIPFLCKLKFDNRSLYLPISYGGTNYYRNFVKKVYKNTFGNNVQVLDDFMSFEDYNHIVRSCNVGIFYHERQQALGNICMLVNFGAKVFLSETSVIFSYFKSIGIKIYSIQHELTQAEIDIPLSDKIILNNRKKLFVLYNKDSLIRNMVQIYESLNNK